jgi:hypothetical protein
MRGHGRQAVRDAEAGSKSAHKEAAVLKSWLAGLARGRRGCMPRELELSDHV